MFLRTRSITVCLVAVLSLGWASVASAETVVGTVAAISPTTGRMVVKLKGKGTNRSLTISKSARVVVDGKKSYLSRVKKGQTVYAVVSGSIISRLIIRSASETDDTEAENTTERSVASTSKKDPRSGSVNVTRRPSTRKSSTTTTAPPDSTPVTVSQRTSNAGEWSQFRGANRDNRSTETGLLSSWSDQGPPLAWTARGLGEGYSAVSVADGKVFTMGNTGGREMVTAIDLATGRQVWATPTGGQAYENGQGNGPRGTPAVADGRVYALGASGQLACMDAESGRVQWSGNILQEYNARNIGWGISESPLIDGDKVICTPGGQRATMVAINKNSGQAEWTALVPSSPRAAYSSAIAIEVGGVRPYVNYTHSGAVGIRASDGNGMWGQNEGSNGTANCSAPIFHDDHVFVASGYNTGGALFRLTSSGGRTTSRTLYSNRDMKNHHGGMVAVDGFLYGTDESILKCINLTTGQMAWQSRSVGKGAVTYADGHIYLRGENGSVALFEASQRGYSEKGQFRQPQRSGRPAWAHPVVAAGKLFLRDMDTLQAYDIKVN